MQYEVGKVQKCVRFLVQRYLQLTSVQIMEANYGGKNRVGVGAINKGRDRYIGSCGKHLRANFFLFLGQGIAHGCPVFSKATALAGITILPWTTRTNSP